MNVAVKTLLMVGAAILVAVPTWYVAFTTVGMVAIAALILALNVTTIACVITARFVRAV